MADAKAFAAWGRDGGGRSRKDRMPAGDLRGGNPTARIRATAMWRWSGASSRPWGRCAASSEKPSKDVAERYFDSGDFLWNVWHLSLQKASTLIEMFETHAPEILAACRSALAGSTEDMSFRVLGRKQCECACPSPVDYRESPSRQPNLRCITLGTAWRATWALGRRCGPILRRTRTSNVVQGQGDIISRGMSVIVTPLAIMACVALVGVDNLIVVAMEDATWSPPRRKRNRSRKVVDRLKDNGHYQAMQHARVPATPGLVSRREPGRPLPGEVHHGKAEGGRCFRSEPSPPVGRPGCEHWNCRSARRGDQVELLSENQSAHPDRARSIGSPIPARFLRF